VSEKWFRGFGQPGRVVDLDPGRVGLGAVLVIGGQVVAARGNERHAHGLRDALAKRAGKDKVANMVMLGAFVKKTGLVSLEALNRVLKDTFSTRDPGILKQNRSALSLGFDYFE
jgi:Pyruvate/2-oxoacid:ferredoxin oxidoreductase gamma subunit